MAQVEFAVPNLKARPTVVHFCAFALERTSTCGVMGLALGYRGGNTVIRREYFMRQAAILFKFAKLTKDPTISAALLEKAANLTSQVDETIPLLPSDQSPRPPDVEPSA